MKEETSREIRKYLETSENKNTTYQNLWDVAETALKRKFIVKNAYIRKSQRSQINTLILKLQ